MSFQLAFILILHRSNACLTEFVNQHILSLGNFLLSQKIFHLKLVDLSSQNEVVLGQTTCCKNQTSLNTLRLIMSTNNMIRNQKDIWKMFYDSLTYGMCPYIDLHIIPAYQMQIWVMTCIKPILASGTILVTYLPRTLSFFLFQISIKDDIPSDSAISATRLKKSSPFVKLFTVQDRCSFNVPLSLAISHPATCC